MEYVVGIDIGTSGCKTVIANSQGEVVSSQSKAYLASDNGTMDPLLWWQAAIETLILCYQQADIAPENIVAVGVSGQMQGCTFVDKQGQPTRNSMLWYDNTPLQESTEFNRYYSELFIRYCGFESAASLMGSKIKWVINHQPEVWEKTDKVLFASTFIAYMLTGNMITDRSNIACSGLNDVAANDWSTELLSITGVTPEKLPPLMDSLDIIGGVSVSASRTTGLRVGTKVIAGCGDVAAECFSVNIEGRSEMKLRLGSAAAINALIPRAWLGEKIDTATPYIYPSTLMIGDYTKGCALSVKWARDTFFSELPKDDSSYIEMDKEACQAELGSGGLIYHPYLNGEHAPYYDPYLRAKFTGINISHNRGNLLRAVYEGISFSIRDVIEKDLHLNSMKEVIFCGGGTKSSVWLPILADVLGLRGILPKNADAAFGVALMAGQASGILDGKAAADYSRSQGRTIVFNPEYHDQYTEIYKKYLIHVTV